MFLSDSVWRALSSRTLSLVRTGTDPVLGATNSTGFEPLRLKSARPDRPLRRWRAYDRSARPFGVGAAAPRQVAISMAGIPWNIALGVSAAAAVRVGRAVGRSERRRNRPRPCARRASGTRRRLRSSPAPLPSPNPAPPPKEGAGSGPPRRLGVPGDGRLPDDRLERPDDPLPRLARQGAQGS